MAALWASAPRVVVPEFEHSLAEMLDDVPAIEINILDERATVIAVKNNMLMFARRPPPFHDHSERVRRAHGRVRHVRRDEERLSFAHEVVNNALAFTNAHFDVALKLIKILFGVDLVKVIAGVRAFDDHDEEVAAVVEIAIAYGRLEFVPVRFDPVFEIDWWFYFGRFHGG
jgi:hypothetical protein